MPNREEHCQHSFERYGVRAEDIHAFLDEPSQLVGSEHREFRHDYETVKLVGEMFGEKYGREIAENVALDHIMLDHEETSEKKRAELQLLKCPNCGGPLGHFLGGKTTCEYCGYQVSIPNSLQKRGWLILYLLNDEALPKALPPLELYSPPTVVDDLYGFLENRGEGQFLLNSLGYAPMRLIDLISNGLTENEVDELVLESKKVSRQQVEELLEKARAKIVEQTQKEKEREEEEQQGFTELNRERKAVMIIMLLVMAATSALCLLLVGVDAAAWCIALFGVALAFVLVFMGRKNPYWK